jgi:hypothetical protein
MGIMRSVKADDDRSHPTVGAILQCLEVDSKAAYKACSDSLAKLTKQTQDKEQKRSTQEVFLFRRTFRTSRYFMVVFRVCDDRGNVLNDYDIFFTAGPDYDPNHLPPKFFVDRQRNSRNPGKLTYFLDYDVMEPWFERPELDDKFGFRIAARPDEGFAHYTVAEHRGTFSALKEYFAPNQTVMIEVVLQRHVRQGVFRLTQDLKPEDFRRQAPGDEIS